MSSPASPLALPVTTLPGIGAYRARALAVAGITTLGDLAHWYPRRYLDRSVLVPIGDLGRHIGSTVTVVGEISGAMLVRGRRPRVVVTLRDTRGTLDLIFFQGTSYWQKAFTAGEVIAASGELAVYGSRPNIVHPDIDRLGLAGSTAEEADPAREPDGLTLLNTGGIIPVYPSSAELEKAGLTRTHGFRRIVRAALERCLPTLEDPLAAIRSALMQEDAATRGTGDASRATPPPPSESTAPDTGVSDPVLRSCLTEDLPAALRMIHRPTTLDDVTRARRRLAFDELFLLSLQMAYQRRRDRSTAPGISFSPSSALARQLVAALPFTLTAAQKRVVREITDDMQRPEPMNRLLQGDVGSGKTVVALLAMLVAVENGCQCALMVPTEILAEQHYRTLTRLVNDLAVNIRLLTGQQGAAQRADTAAGVAGGTVHILVGTHALIQKDVAFHRLGLVVIDEQHRFGVAQRATLRGKGERPDMLVMTATPIPRTLAMTVYGDLDVSVIDQLPKGRRPVRTAVRFVEDRPTVWRALDEEVADGRQAYIVFPLVSESEKLDLRAASEEYERLAAGAFAHRRLALLHGQMSAADKDEVMQRFVRGEVDILVSTTVIEVGVDVPNASIMVIEHAERFGLAQLHQLRGRVGRGSHQSYCILMTEKRIFYSAPRVTDDEKRAATDARKRLESMRDTTDGFRLAEIDLEIRGPGDMWGTMQSGFPELRAADLVRDGDILKAARTLAFDIVERDAALEHPDHAAIRRVLGPVLRQRLAHADIA